MGKIHTHRHGSLAFRPRKRASGLSPRVKAWHESAEPSLLGFAAFKAGMTHAVMVDDTNSPSKGFEISVPVTVVETPSMIVYGIRAYVNTFDGSRKTFADAYASDESLLKSLFLSKNSGLSKIESAAEKISDISVLAATQPGRTCVGQKKPHYVEIAVGGKDARQKLDFAKGLLGKEVSAKSVFKEGEFVDAIAVTKGKGWQGAVKRFGVALQRRKATGRRRHVGTLGPWHPARVMYTTPMAGQMGFHRRTQLNNRILKIGEKPAEASVDGGFKGYGVIKNSFMLLKGSLQGPRKRPIVLRKALRVHDAKKPEVKLVSLSSKQGL